MRKAQKHAAQIAVEGRPVAVLVHFERRANVRFGIAKRGVTLRLPQGYGSSEAASELARLEQWVGETLAKKPSVRPLIFGSEKTYQTGDVLRVGQRVYTLDVRQETRDTHTARLKNGTIFLCLSDKSEPKYLEKAIKHLISRVVAADFLPEITRRTLDLNRLHFAQNITSVTLKYNHSNWGSCSSKRNLNLSTRLLFAPAEVQDYVIIHELAHLIEMNHSPRFWALVARAMPDFEEKERWLKKHGKACDF